MQVQDNKVVSIHYTLKDDAGEILDTSDGREPLAYIQGSGNIIKGLEEALVDKKAGEQVEVSLEPEQGYGEYREELVQKVPQEALKEIENVHTGMQLQAQTEQGPIPVVVTEVTDSEVTVDANHALAGKNLHFDVKVEDVREATEEEVSQGKVAEA